MSSLIVRNPLGNHTQHLLPFFLLHCLVMRRYLIVLSCHFLFQVPLMGPGICLLLITRLDTLIQFESLAWTADLILDELPGLSGP